MNANVPMLDEVAGNNTKEVIEALNKTIRQQQAEIEALKKENEELSVLCVEFNVLRKAQEK